MCSRNNDGWPRDCHEICISPLLSATWLWLKLAGVACLVVYHVICGRYVKAINADSDDHSHVFYRFFNEVPVLFLFAIVILVVLKPF